MSAWAEHRETKPQEPSKRKKEKEETSDKTPEKNAKSKRWSMGLFGKAKMDPNPNGQENGASSSTQALLVNDDADVSTSSNVSSSSTLIPEVTSRRTPVTDYDAFIAQAQETAQREAGNDRWTESTSPTQRLWQRARAAGANSRRWPEDPWGGGFGPRAAEDTREIGVDAWLRRNRLKK